MKRSFSLIFLIALIGLLAWHLVQEMNTEKKSNPTFSSYFDILRYAQTQVRKNPAHLPAQFQHIVNSQKPEKLIHFVRTHFDVIPPKRGWNYSETDRSWGGYGALRAGAGTPRDLVELFVTGIDEMGFETEIVTIKTPPAIRSFNRSPLKQNEWTWSPDKHLIEQVNGVPLPASPAYNEHSSFWERVYNAIPEDNWNVAPLSSQLPQKLPSVVVHFPKTDSTEAHSQLVNLWSQDSNSYSTSEYSRSFKAPSKLDVTLSLFMKTDDHNWSNMPKLLETTISQDKIAGGRIMLGFSPVLDNLGAAFTVKPSDVSNFIPYIKNQNQDNEQEEQNHFGPLITNRGEVGTFSDDGKTLSFGSHQLKFNGDSNRVSAIQLKQVSTTNYPWISVHFDPIDKEGEIVEALSPREFKLNLDEKTLALHLTSNTPPPPKIVFLIDGSNSVAPEYRAKNLGNVVLNMTKGILEDFPNAKFKVMTDSPVILTGKWSQDPEYIAKTASSVGDTENNMWRSVIKTKDLDPDLVIFFTDGNDVDRKTGGKGAPYESLPLSYKKGLTAAPPTFLLGGARPPEYLLGAPFGDIAKATGGKAFEITEHNVAISAIRSELQNLLGTYRGWIKAPPSDNELSHSLEISIHNSVDTMSVDIPAPSLRAYPPSVTGLYLFIQRPGSRGSMHRLAGQAYKTKHASSEDAQNARLGLFGKYTLIAEAGAPSIPQVLDEMITYRLGWEKVLNASTAEDAVTALANVQSLPRSAFSYGVPLNKVYEHGLRFWLDAEQRIVKEGHELLIKRTDILPLLLYGTDPDPVLARNHTFQAANIINNIESAIHNTSHKCLDGHLTLSSSHRFSIDRKFQLNKLTDGYRREFSYVIPEVGEINCAIGINTRSGATQFINEYGGAGITVEEIKRRFDAVDYLLELASDAGSTFGAWASLEKIKMKHLRSATIAIHTMMPPDLLGLYKGMACDAAQDQLGSVINSGINVLGNSAASQGWESFNDLNDFANALGMGGINTDLPIPGCD